MSSRLSLVISAVAIWSGGIHALAQVNEQQIINAIRSDETSGLVQEINSLPAAARQASAANVARLAAREFASDREYNDGKQLLTLLPSIADDELLARSLQPYLENQDNIVRGIAFEALSRGSGNAVGTLLSLKIKTLFGQMPDLPFQAADEANAREANDNAANFVYCLKGLLKSDSNLTRGVGLQYLAMFRSRYSGNIQGKEIVKGLEQELVRAGLTAEGASFALSERIPPPRQAATPAATVPGAPPSSAMPTPKGDEGPASIAKRISPTELLVVTSLVIVLILAFAFMRRSQPPPR